MANRLVKSATDKKLFGVCGGLGIYFDIDPTVIRIIFLLAFFMFGAGPLIYLVLAVAMPSE